jgi:hypothetical protein
MLGDVIGAVANFIHQVWVWFQTVVPGGFGLLLIPLAILALITILVSRNR